MDCGDYMFIGMVVAGLDWFLCYLFYKDRMERTDKLELSITGFICFVVSVLFWPAALVLGLLLTGHYFISSNKIKNSENKELGEY